MAGADFNPLGIFSISYPVPTGTPTISSLVQWDHTQSWRIPELEEYAVGKSAAGGGSSCSFEIDVSPQSEEHYLIGHKIDGRLLFPGTGYLVLAWKALAKLNGQAFENMPVLMENVEIGRAVILPKEGTQIDVTPLASKR